jgi:type I restriction enzyme R subunit
MFRLPKKIIFMPISSGSWRFTTANKKQLAEVGRNSFTDEEFEKILIYLEGGTRFEKAKKLRDLYPLDTANGQRIWVEFLNRTQWCQNEFQVSSQITVEGRKL